MKQPTFCGRELLSLSVIEAARAGDDLDGTPHVRVDEYMKRRLQSRLIRAILNSP